MFYKKYLKYIFFFFILFGSFEVNASIINGTIDPTNHNAQVCENTSCTVSSTSPINFGVFSSTPASNVTVTDTSLSGYIWGASFGWVVLNCSNTTSGCSATNGNFKVANDYNGHLSGYAWGENSGWINFGPFTNSATSPVAINSSGQFTGYAWSGNNGWIKFDCGSGVNYCVQTDWRPRNTRPQCSDGADNDADGAVDGADSGCINGGVYDPTDNTELISGGIGIGCTGPGCNVPLCTTNPTHPSCVTTPFCTLNPTHPSCVTQLPFCTLNPTHPSCVVTPPPFCTLNPTHPSCVTTPFCTLNPTHPSCVTQLPFCTLNPTHPSCVVTPPPFCTLNPTHPSCVTTILPVKSILPVVAGILGTPKGELITKTIVTTGAISGVILSFATVLFANPLTFTELFLIPFRLWSLLLSALGLKKRNRPWGIVYDSVTKQPLDPAYVVLQDLQGNEVMTSITDLDGRYGFLVPAGDYRMIANKTNYEFPSKKLAGKDSDELYSDLYFSEVISITEGGVITKNIPMDSLKFDWNEFAKKDQKLMKFFSKRDIWITRISNILFYFGFLMTIVATTVAPKTYNIITLCVYVILFILKRTVLKPRPFGRIKFKSNGMPLSFAVIRVYSSLLNKEVIHKVSDKTGKYYCLIPNGTYYVKIEAKNEDETYSLVYTSENITVRNGYINKKFEL